VQSWVFFSPQMYTFVKVIVFKTAYKDSQSAEQCLVGRSDDLD
jgi:hypothetical protein